MVMILKEFCLVEARAWDSVLEPGVRNLEVRPAGSLQKRVEVILGVQVKLRVCGLRA